MSLPHSNPPATRFDVRYPLSAWFLGPRAENAGVWTELLDHIFQDYVHWRRNYFPADPWIVGRYRRRSPEHESCWTCSRGSWMPSSANSSSISRCIRPDITRT